MRKRIRDILRFAPEAVGPSWYRPIHDPEQRKSLYASEAEAIPTHSEVVFYESMSGARMMDSPFAIFEELERHPLLHNRFLHVWSVRSQSIVPEQVQDRENVVFVTRHSPAYIYYLVRAKYIVCNSVLPEYFVRKIDQLYLNTWHGIGYKRLGRSKDAPLGAALAVSNMLQSTHVISPCAFMTDTHEQAFSMAGTYTGELAETGYPRVDTTINASERELAEVKQALGIDSSKDTVLYAPTWRGSDKGSHFDADHLRNDLSRISQLDVNLIFLGHHIMMKHVSSLDFTNIIVPPANSNTNRLIAIADLLITDYSSIFFDYLVIGRPIIHYLYDYEHYKDTRGLTLSRAALPGVIAYTSHELVTSVSELLPTDDYTPTDQHLGALARFCPHDDGQAAARVVDWFFRGHKEGIKLIPRSSRRSICFWGGRLVESEESREFLQRLRSEVYANATAITLFVAHAAIKNPDLRELIYDVGDRISVIARAGYSFAMTSDEARARSTLSKHSLPETTNLYKNIYRREYRRLFGDTKFDEVILAENLTTFWRELSKYAYR